MCFGITGWGGIVTRSRFGSRVVGRSGVGGVLGPKTEEPPASAGGSTSAFLGRSPLRKKEDRVLGHGLSTLTAPHDRVKARSGTRVERRVMVVSVIRRTFRLGLWLGLLVGIAFAVAKLLRPRSSPATIDLGSPGGS